MTNNIIKLIENRIIEEYETLERLASIDKKYNLTKFDKNNISKIFSEFYNKDKKDFLKKSIGIIYFGDYEFTIYFALYAIQNNIELSLFTQDYHYSINQGIIHIINEILDDNNYSKIQLYNMISWKKIEEFSKNIDKLICFGDNNSYNILKNMKIHNLKNFKYSIKIYTDNIEFEKTEKQIILLAYNTCIEIRKVIDLSEIELIDEIYVVILTKNRDLINDLKGKNTNIIINDNPFKYMKKDYELVEKIYIK